MKSDEAELIIEACLRAVSEQYVMPLALALGTLTAAVCRDREMAAAVADVLRKQAESCPPDVAGRALLLSLAGLAAQPDGAAQGDVESALRKSLRLIPGGRDSQNPEAPAPDWNKS